MSENIKFVIIDDSAQARKLLRLMLLELAPGIMCVGEAENVVEGLKLIEREQPDAVFLDIEMPGRSGMQLAEELCSSKFKGSIVFTTAYNAYAIKAFRLSALDYLLKPISEDHLLEAVAKLQQQKNNLDNQTKLTALTANLGDEGNNLLCIPVQGGYEYIPIHEIYYLEADGSYVKIVCAGNKQKIVSKNLKYFETTLESVPKFIRTHRSFLVNLDQVSSYSKADGGSLILSNGAKIPISRERRQVVQEYLK
jgi:two-component system LytT family response regulator